MALIDDIAQHLHNNSIGSLGTSLFKAYLPDSVDEAIAVLDTGGTDPDIDIPTKSPTFQIFIRSATYSGGKTNLDAVRDLLHRTYNETIGDTYFYRINAVSEGGHLGRNDAGLDEFSINFTCLTR